MKKQITTLLIVFSVFSLGCIKKGQIEPPDKYIILLNEHPVVCNQIQRSAYGGAILIDCAWAENPERKVPDLYEATNFTIKKDMR